MLRACACARACVSHQITTRRQHETHSQANNAYVGEDTWGKVQRSQQHDRRNQGEQATAVCTNEAGWDRAGWMGVDGLRLGEMVQDGVGWGVLEVGWGRMGDDEDRMG